MAHSSYERLEHAGGAADTTLASNLAQNGTSISVADGTGWPTGGTGRFVIVIDPGETNEEKILCASRSGNTITVTAASDRGFDSTSDVAHTSGAVVRHCFSATEADEANQAVGETIGTITTAEDLIVADSGTSFKRLAVGTEAYPLVVSSSAVAWGQLQTGGIADSAVTTAKIAADTITANDVDSSSFKPLIGETLTTLTDKTTHTAIDGSTYEQWGTEEATVTDPNVDVIVKARLIGTWGVNASTALINSLVRVEISLDGGSTWSNGLATNNIFPDMGDIDPSGSVRFGCVAAHRVAGTPTGDIQARVRVTQDAGSSGHSRWRYGQIEMEVYQNE